VDVPATVAALVWMNSAAVAQAATGASNGRPAFNVVDYGAKDGGSVNAASAFKAVIAAATAAGGGTVFVPAGHYTSGPIELASNITLDVDAGATIAFPVAPLAIVKRRYLGVEALVPCR
jgi:polygalacturonase